jgi:hypothetical protein
MKRQYSIVSTWVSQFLDLYKSTNPQLLAKFRKSIASRSFDIEPIQHKPLTEEQKKAIDKERQALFDKANAQVKETSSSNDDINNRPKISMEELTKFNNLASSHHQQEQPKPEWEDDEFKEDPLLAQILITERKCELAKKDQDEEAKQAKKQMVPSSSLSSSSSSSSTLASASSSTSSSSHPSSTSKHKKHKKKAKKSSNKSSHNSDNNKTAQPEESLEEEEDDEMEQQGDKIRIISSASSSSASLTRSQTGGSKKRVKKTKKYNIPFPLSFSVPLPERKDRTLAGPMCVVCLKTFSSPESIHPCPLCAGLTYCSSGSSFLLPLFLVILLLLPPECSSLLVFAPAVLLQNAN